MIKGLSHVCIYMGDLQEAEEIFVNTLEMPYVEELVNSDKKKFGFIVNAGNKTFIKIIKSDLYTTRFSYNICFEVEDIYEIHKLLTRLAQNITAVRRGKIDKTLQFFWYISFTTIEFCQFDEESVFRQKGLV